MAWLTVTLIDLIGKRTAELSSLPTTEILSLGLSFQTKLRCALLSWTGLFILFSFHMQWVFTPMSCLGADTETSALWRLLCYKVLLWFLPTAALLIMNLFGVYLMFKISKELLYNYWSSIFVQLGKEQTLPTRHLAAIKWGKNVDIHLKLILNCYSDTELTRFDRTASPFLCESTFLLGSMWWGFMR